jgi:4-amino-4-deoxy-L-arabinose transferase-like glycosyltransferase
LTTTQILPIPRNNMMDFFPVFFSRTLSHFFIKAETDDKHLLLFFLFFGPVFMTKNVIAFLLLPEVFTYVALYKIWRLLRNRYLFSGLLLFLLIVLCPTPQQSRALWKCFLE